MRNRHGCLICLCVLLLALAGERIEAQVEAAKNKRRVYVLHSGMHVILAPEDKNHAVKTLKAWLLERGVPERDVVALDCPYPTASFGDMVPRGGLLMYLESADPASRSSHDAYLRLHKALQSQGVTPRDDVVWIGHSAGGQMGMSMANLARHLEMHPELARKTQPYHFEAVITLGSAVGSNPVPADVKLRHYHSSGDTMIYFLSKHGNLVADSMKSKVNFRTSCDVKGDVKIREFPGIEHAEWITRPEVLERILREFEPNYCPAWRQAQSDVNRGTGLAQLLAKALEAEWKISLEAPQP